jgi:hypothetical protein
MLADRPVQGTIQQRAVHTGKELFITNLNETVMLSLRQRGDLSDSQPLEGGREGKH